MPKFECLRCGTCCRKLLRKMRNWTLGLFILPNEMTLFPAEHLAPMWGIGLKGRSRPRPEAVVVVQYASEPCLHLTSDNQCRIYEKRPLVCRAHPLSLTIQENMVLSASISEDCKGARDIIGKQATLADYFTEEIVRANAVLNAYYDNMLKQSGGLLWLYDLNSEKWKRINIQLVTRHLNV